MKRGNYKTRKAYKQDVNRNRGGTIHQSGQMPAWAIENEKVRRNVASRQSLGASIAHLAMLMFARGGQR